jgi:hypothetical protein
MKINFVKKQAEIKNKKTTENEQSLECIWH